MSSIASLPSVPGLRRAARTLWPLCLLVPFVGSTAVPAYAFGDLTAGQTVLQIGSISIGIALAGFAIGGRDGLVATFVLAVISLYCAWWLSLGIDNNISPYTWSRAADGLNHWSRYIAGAAVNVWPLLLAAGVAVALLGRPLGVAPWRAVSLLALTLLVLATPYRAAWSDGCNTHAGAAPAILTPVVSELMDSGIGVMPDSSSTLANCVRVARRPGAAGPAGRPLATGALEAVLERRRRPSRRSLLALGRAASEVGVAQPRASANLAVRSATSPRTTTA